MEYISKKLNIGCGNDVKVGFVNLDSKRLPGVDVVYDIEMLPFPFGSEEFAEVLCQDVLEHVDYIPVLQDIHRIMKYGGRLKVRVPHFTSKNSYTDPTHRKFFAARTFHFFSKKSVKNRSYYFRFSFEKIEETYITFEKSSPLFFYNRFVEWAVNKNDRTRYLFESTFLSRLFPAENIVVTLRK